MNQKKSLFTLLVLSLFLISCSTTKERSRSDDFSPKKVIGNVTGEEQTGDIDELVKQGKIDEAAKLALTLASTANYPERYDYQLKATHLYVQNKAYTVAKKLLSKIAADQLSPEQLTYFAYLNASIAAAFRDAEKSKQWLVYFQNADKLSFASEKDVLKLVIAIDELLGDTQSAVFKRIKLETLLSDEAEIITNQQAIIRGFLLFSKTDLEKLNSNHLSPAGAAWLELTLLVTQSKNPFRLGNQLASWKERHPDSSIRNEIIAALAPQQDIEQIKIENIALLLPLSGPVKRPASAIRDGFLANYYAADSTENRPVIRIYNTADAKENIANIYQRAIDEGADIVVGPLRKESIEVLVKESNISTPTLVLNQLGNSDFYAENFYQFALSPEFEAKQTAQRAWQDGHQRAAILFPDNQWGQRVVAAFETEWEKLGGEIVAENSYITKNNDFSVPIKSLLAIDKSYERKKALSRLLRAKLSFEPRRRQDIDFIFMAAFPRQARLIPPQLKFFHAGNLPIYATSHSFSGRIDRKKDRDLNQLILGDMPWTLTDARKNNTKQQIYQTWPVRSKLFNRFYAFGSDAYYLLDYLNWLRGNSLARLNAATGKLYMNETNQVLRELTWARFKNGIPRLLPVTAQPAKILTGS